MEKHWRVHTQQYSHTWWHKQWAIVSQVEARAKRMPLEWWSEYEAGRKRRRTATPVGPVMPIYEAHELHPSRVAEPVLKHSKLMVCDVVCCDVRPPDWYGPRCLDHMIHEFGTWTDGSTRRRIGNTRKPPHMIGGCAPGHIYGLLVDAVTDEEYTA